MNDRPLTTAEQRLEDEIDRMNLDDDLAGRNDVGELHASESYCVDCGAICMQKYLWEGLCPDCREPD